MLLSLDKGLAIERLAKLLTGRIRSILLLWTSYKFLLFVLCELSGNIGLDMEGKAVDLVISMQTHFPS